MTSAATTLSAIPAATARLSHGALVVSVHDIASSTRETAEEMIAELSRRGVSSTSLLVVPNYHHTGSIADDRELGIWLRELEGRGHEIVIHGYFHDRPRRENETLPEKFMTRFYTDDEGEFFDLSYDEALQRITRARDEFRSLGFNPRGFIAPAWLLSAEGERAAKDAGMDYTTRLGSVRDLKEGRIVHARSLVYSVRSQWRRSASLAWNSAFFFAAKQHPLVRLSLHPPDYLHREVWNQILRLIDELLARRTVATYAAWIDERRAAARNA
jgi:predicted deacetylase